jgi:hypothetical protein
MLATTIEVEANPVVPFDDVGNRRWLSMETEDG